MEKDGRRIKRINADLFAVESGRGGVYAERRHCIQNVSVAYS
jgi:hypothetical protein